MCLSCKQPSSDYKIFQGSHNSFKVGSTPPIHPPLEIVGAIVLLSQKSRARQLYESLAYPEEVWSSGSRFHSGARCLVMT